MIVKWLDDENIVQQSSQFLSLYNSDNSTPVDIEKIVEKDFGIFILPSKNLESYCEVDGYIDGDFKTIGVDEYEYLNQEARSRFTFAHELGHLILHRKIYESKKPKTIESFMDFQNGLDNADWKRLEFQAYRFAEELLLPRQEYLDVVKQEIRKIGGMSNILIDDLAGINKKVKEVFFVSGSCAGTRMRRVFPEIISAAESNLPF